ncbi:type I pantothenate kinase, partial [Acinetobacter baumannii]|nr:type I pantothenate kinase [Acinetobacter baumannii]
MKHHRFKVFGDSKNMLMSQKEQTLMTPYLQFNRHQWAALR